MALNGKMPIDWRLSFMFNKEEARGHLTQILNWEPKVLVMSHGEIVKNNTGKFLDSSFKWLR